MNLKNYVLEDDSSPYGGVSYDRQTLGEFAEEVNEKWFFDLIKQRKINDINKVLKECGIKPIKENQNE